MVMNKQKEKEEWIRRRLGQHEDKRIEIISRNGGSQRDIQFNLEKMSKLMPTH